MAPSVDPRSDATTGYHVFIEPAGPLAAELRMLIERLAGECGGPVFAPHVTVLARIPECDEQAMLRNAEALASSLAPFSITLGELASEHAYYRALYSKVIEQDRMRAVHENAAQAFSCAQDPYYLAHLSLLYGLFDDMTIDRIKGRISLPEEKTFAVDRLHVYRTEGRVGEWYKITEFPFTA